MTHPIDERADRCEANSRSTSDSVKCGDNARASWDVELNKAYKELQKEETPAQKQALTGSEKEWMKFRDLEFNSIDEIYNNQGLGTMARPWSAFAKSDIVKERTIELQNRAGNDSNGGVADRISVPAGDMLYIDRLGQAYDDADASLNRNYKALMDNLNKEGQDALKASERQWVKFRDAEFNTIDSSFDQRYSGNRVESLQSKLDIVLKRSNHLQHQLDLLIENKAD